MTGRRGCGSHAPNDGWSAERWRDLAELGVVGSVVEEAAGGFGGGGFDLMVVFEALGRALVVEPLLEAAMAARALSPAADTSELGCLKGLVEGRSVLSFAHQEAGGGPNSGDIAAEGQRAEPGGHARG